MTPAPTLDLTLSLPGDFFTKFYHGPGGLGGLVSPLIDPPPPVWGSIDLGEELAAGGVGVD